MTPTYVPVQPAMQYPAPAFNPPPANRAPVASAPRPAAPARPQPLVRAKGPDEPEPPRPAPVAMPSPDQLGVTVRPAAPAGPDWAAVHARIKELGVVDYHMGSLPDGRFRFTCWVHGGRPDLARRIEAVAATEAEAIHSGLERAALARTAGH